MGHARGCCEHEFEPKRDWILIVTALLLLVVGLVLKKNLSFLFQLTLFSIAYLLVAWDVLFLAFNNFVKGRALDEHFLMSIATIGAFVLLEFPEAVAVILFYKVGEYMQQLAVSNSRQSIKTLLALRPEHANVYENNVITPLDPEKVKVGQRIAIRPGERVPLDGKVLEGTSKLDTSALTGESIPRSIQPGDRILAGMINTHGFLVVEVTKAFAESSVNRILEMVESAGEKKAETEKFISKVAKIYTPVVVVLALLIATLPPLLFSNELFADWVSRALVLLVISCPCGLVISIPLGYFGGIGGAAKQGILIKGAAYLDVLTQLKVVCFDKTGTLTKGNFVVSKIVPSENISRDLLLKYTAYAEQHSTHPLATPIKQAYSKKISTEDIEDYKEIAGLGVYARVFGNEVLVGNTRLLDQYHVLHEGHQEEGTTLHVAINQQYAGYLFITDEIKEDAHKAVKEIKALGVREVMMLTGDHQSIASKVGQELGIEAIHAQLLPEEKLEKVEEALSKLSGKDEKLAFVGDGINDAPVLARADIGIAMGGLGSDAAIETADVVIMTDAPSKLAEAVSKARETRTIVWQNITFALVIKSIFVVLSSFGEVTMWQAIFADVGVALLAIANSTRLLRGLKQPVHFLGEF